MNRPVGVTILGWLAIVGGVLAILGAFGAIAAGLALLALTAGASVIVLAFAVWIGILGVVDIIFGYGALKLSPWAWTLGVVLMIVNVVSSLLQLISAHGSFGGFIIGLAIDAFILYYLFTPDVKAAFGKTGVGPDVPALTGQASYTPPPAQQAPPAGYAPPTTPVAPAPPAPAAPAPPAPPAPAAPAAPAPSAPPAPPAPPAP